MDLKGQFRVIMGQNGPKLTQNCQKRIIEPREPNKTTTPTQFEELRINCDTKV